MTQTASTDELLANLRRLLERSCWDEHTSVCPDEWTTRRPSLGQCAVTALVVQDAFGGDLLRGEVRGDSHYWNRLPDGREVDLTRDQFDNFLLDGPAVVRPREYLMTSRLTVLRYQLLVERLSNVWKR